MITLWQYRHSVNMRDAMKLSESNLVNYANFELSLLTDDPNDKMQQEMNSGIIQIVEIFSRQGHSGFSAAYAIRLLEKLLRFEPLTPLTGHDDEWGDVTDEFFQNKRCFHVFKEKTTGRAYDIDGKIFRDPDGSCFTNADSRVYIEFPYTPKREYVDRIVTEE
jgi:hypothetical protein